MKTVLLIRHAKSSWDIPELDDFLRPLNQRGYNDALKLSEFMQHHQLVPGLVVSSPAVRTYSTAMIIMHQLALTTSQLILDPYLYESTLENYVLAVNSAIAQTNRMALVGHNDTITEFASYLTGSPVERLKTTAMLVIDFKAMDNNVSLANTGQLRLRYDVK